MESRKVSLFKRILVCFDGSDNAEKALKTAIAIATASGADLWIIVAAETTGLPSRYMERYYSNFREDIIRYAREQLAIAVSRATAAGLKSVDGRVVEGHPVQAILSEEKTFKADLVVVGRRGLRGFRKLLLGSVSSGTVSNSTCNVLVVS